MLESGTGSARPFPSEPEDPQGEEGVAARASRHENAEALIFTSFFSYFHPVFCYREGVSQERAAETPLPLHHAGDDISGDAAPLRQTPA